RRHRLARCLPGPRQPGPAQEPGRVGGTGATDAVRRGGTGYLVRRAHAAATAPALAVDRADPAGAHLHAHHHHRAAGALAGTLRGGGQESAHPGPAGSAATARGAPLTYLLVKWLHILSSTLLFGTGLGSAFYMYFASRTRDVRVVATVAKYVVIADWVFTTPTVILQPLTGFWLIHLAGYPLATPWILWSLGLYLLTG